MSRLLALCVLALAACSPSFEPQYLVTDLRILGIRAEADGGPTADPIPGATVVLRALVANPRARPGAIVRWYACVPSASDATAPCADAAMLGDPARLLADPRVLQIGACSPDPGGECGVAVTLPDVTAAIAYALSTAARDPAYACRPYVEWPVLAVGQAAGRQVFALKRIRIVPTAAQLAAQGISQTYVPNVNPDVTSVVRSRPTWGTCAGGVPVVPGPFPAGETTLCAGASPGAAEDFTACGPAGERSTTRENAAWQWFVTAGKFPEFSDGIGNASRNEPRFERPAGAFTLWVVVRDGRGGEGWVRSDIGAAP